MVSTRRIKSLFSEGEFALCFEPDRHKAKRLYEAKILEVSHHINSSGRRCNKYLVHFHGWNVHWDRFVDEELILPDTPENRECMEELDRLRESGKSKKQQRQPSGSSSTSSYRSGLSEPSDSDFTLFSNIMDSSSNDSHDGIVITTPKLKRKQKDVESDKKPAFRSREKGGDTAVILHNPHNLDVKRRKLDFDAIANNPGTFTQNVANRKLLKKLKQIKEDLLDNNLQLELDRSDDMLLLLYEDYERVVTNKKLFKLPAKMSVLTILENFVKADIERFICDVAISKQTFVEMKIAVTKRLNLLTSFTSQLLLLFDNILPERLYTDDEKSQKEKMMNKQKNSEKIIKHHRSFSPRLCIEQVQKSISVKLEVKGEDELDDVDGLDEASNIRITRSHQQKEQILSKSPTPSIGSQVGGRGSSEEVVERRMTRGRASTSTSVVKKEPVDGEHEASLQEDGDECERLERRRRCSQRLATGVTAPRDVVEPPVVSEEQNGDVCPPALTLTHQRVLKVKKEGNAGGSRCSSVCSIPTRRSSSKLQQEQYIQPLLSRVNQWSLCSVDSMRKHDVLPFSFIYGAPHLLRLIDCLPLLITFERGGENRMKLLQKLLEDLILFMCERSSELMPEGQYIDAQ